MSSVAKSERCGPLILLGPALYGVEGDSRTIVVVGSRLGSSFGRVIANSRTLSHPDDANNMSEKAVAAKGT